VDPIIGSALIGAGSNIIGGLFDRAGQSSANAANLQIARENRAWQQKMSNTAYQRAAKDLEAAGLNRILAIGSPSTTPAGNTATMLNKNKGLGEQLGKAVGSGLQAAMLKAQIDNVKAQTRLTDAQRDALGPAATAGGEIEQAIFSAKKRLSPSAVDYKNLIKETGKRASEYKNPANEAGKTARNKIRDLAISMNIKPDENEQRLLNVVRQMDLPKMSDEEALEWAYNNQDKIKKYLERIGIN